MDIFDEVSKKPCPNAHEHPTIGKKLLKKTTYKVLWWDSNVSICSSSIHKYRCSLPIEKCVPFSKNAYISEQRKLKYRHFVFQIRRHPTKRRRCLPLPATVAARDANTKPNRLRPRRQQLPPLRPRPPPGLTRSNTRELAAPAKFPSRTRWTVTRTRVAARRRVCEVFLVSLGVRRRRSSNATPPRPSAATRWGETTGGS